ncbi:MAG: hypothetical protein DBY37_04255 [Desulfovibrionaceae bacterium]|nr:MAG: hypothetical protein DBY37_04255 [Desulfovibrionaceae bacterium]
MRNMIHPGKSSVSGRGRNSGGSDARRSRRGGAVCDRQGSSSQHSETQRHPRQTSDPMNEDGKAVEGVARQIQPPG